MPGKLLHFPAPRPARPTFTQRIGNITVVSDQPLTADDWDNLLIDMARSGVRVGPELKELVR